MREIEVSADSDAARKPANPSKKIMLIIASGLIDFSSIFLREILVVQTLFSLHRVQHGHSQ